MWLLDVRGMGVNTRGLNHMQSQPKCIIHTCISTPPPCNSYALVQATVGVGTVLIWYLILIRYKCSAAA